jgi:hypothetical protein
MSRGGLREAPAAEVAAARAQDTAPSPQDAVCVLGIVTTVRRSTPATPSGTNGHHAGALALLKQAAPLYEEHDVHPHVLYLYYAPDPGQCLTEQEGRDLLRRLAQDAQYARNAENAQNSSQRAAGAAMTSAAASVVASSGTDERPTGRK